MNISGDDSCGDLCKWNRWKWDKSSFANQPETGETYHTLGYGRCSSSNCCRTVIFRSVLYLDVKTWFDCGVSGTTNLGYSGARKKFPKRLLSGLHWLERIPRIQESICWELAIRRDICPKGPRLVEVSSFRLAYLQFPHVIRRLVVSTDNQCQDRCCFLARIVSISIEHDVRSLIRFLARSQ